MEVRDLELERPWPVAENQGLHGPAPARRQRAGRQDKRAVNELFLGNHVSADVLADACIAASRLIAPPL